MAQSEADKFKKRDDDQSPASEEENIKLPGV